MNESISALMDAELEEPDSIEILKNLKLNEELQQVWDEYHLIGDAIRSNSLLTINVREQVSSKIQAEPIVFAPRPWFAAKTRQRWAAGVALAASVTLGITAGWPLFKQQATQSVGMQMTASQPTGVDQLAVMPAREGESSPYLAAHQDMSTDPNVVEVSLSGDGER